jgi:peptidyl-prolyl cis-trans isomerase SurA|tara:strand:+ start:4 stop:939 length:936 start_codon:yes stop_codon:yes gene_type:complete
MKNIKKLPVFFILILLLGINKTISATEVFIAFKVNNNIITNLDIEKESKYLQALNKELKTLDKKEIYELAKNSIIKEKVKKDEILKFYQLDGTNKFLDELVRNFYLRLNISNLEDFTTHLNNFDLKLDEIVKKIEIETVWNELIFKKYNNQVKININEIKKKINKEIKGEKIQEQILLSEILFLADNDKDFQKKYLMIKDDINKSGFKNAANIHSISETSKFGGEVGWIKKGQLSDLLKKQILSLSIGETTIPIKLPNGFLILRLDDKKNVEVEINLEKELQNSISYERNKQLNQFSLIYFNKIKVNTVIK